MIGDPSPDPTIPPLEVAYQEGVNFANTSYECERQSLLAANDIEENAASEPLSVSNSSRETSRNLRCWSTPSFSGNLPGQRAAHNCDTVDNLKLYVFGGWNGKHALNDTHVFDTRSSTWTEILPLISPPKRNNHCSAVVGSLIFIHGGHDGVDWLDDTYLFDTQTHEWKEITFLGQVPMGRACHTLSHHNNKLYMFGGYDGARCFDDLDILDLSTMIWTRPKVDGAAPKPRNAHTVTVVGDKLFLFGGHSGTKHLTDLHIFDTNTLTWSRPQTIGIAPPGLRGHSANLIGDRIFIFGGYDGKGRSNRTYILETDRMKWIHAPEAANAPHGRQRHSACLSGSRHLYIFGGFDGTKWLNDMHILDIARLTKDTLTDSNIRELVKDMKSLYENPLFSDLTLIVEGKRIPAHRNILASRSQYFNGMLRTKMKEAITSEVLIPEPWTYAGLRGILEYLYTGNFSESEPRIMCEILGLADFYLLDHLKHLVQMELENAVDTQNVCSILTSASLYQAAELMSFCENYILKHANTVIGTPEFKNLKNHPDLMLRITKLSLTKRAYDHPSLPSPREETL